MNVLAIDPGAKPGLCYRPRVGNYLVDYRPELFVGLPIDEVIIEDQHLASFIYKNGKRTRVSKKSQLTLVRTAERLLMMFPDAAQYRMLPDVWRRRLWPGASRLTKPVVLARLEREYSTLVNHLPAKNRPDALESCGLFAAWLTVPEGEKAQYRVR